jgi:invasion protein IalB
VDRRVSTVWSESRLSAAIFPALALSAFACVAPLFAQPLDVTRGDWQVSCESADRDCVISQSLMSDDRSWLATVLMQPIGEGDRARVQVLVPTGVHLASGLFVEAGRKEGQGAEWLVCTQKACRAELVLDPEGLAAWKQGRSAEIRYRSRIDGPVVAFDMSLMGLTAALDDVMAAP